jgi:hypothetical protein
MPNEPGLIQSIEILQSGLSGLLLDAKKTDDRTPQYHPRKLGGSQQTQPRKER